MNKKSFRIFVICFALILLSLGTFIGFKVTEKQYQNEQNSNNKVEKEDDEKKDIVAPVINKEETKDIEVVLEDYYTLCKESIENKNMEFGSTTEKIKEKYSNNYKVEKEDKNYIKLKREIDTNCPNHFKLKLVNDYVVIYSLVTQDKEEMYKSTDIPKESLREEVIEELEKGIIVNTLHDLEVILEDIES